MSINEFLEKLAAQPQHISFVDTMSVIAENYEFTETAFSNGQQINDLGENSGSCKLFAFAKLQKFNESQTLACFGTYYRDHVLQHPDGDDHQNIRQFMVSGWQGVTFSGLALAEK